ncbi:acylneuraminate cytidylyltransferase family protein [Bradyrhizobium sp. WYCCWR 13023]|uniref:Acylneuraminate cytidylyltransferase family protein n=1 Tax=Bradyrhizobium zhengyangense TaxID=2911009 RepID=A0A9X1RAW6_9BRAD|nr:acylneuraminate cytidylyltransferase family protein [Bradyrhizobium zhengyangense]MCG2630712.1 acylneuraminate cytidylyltransferase family protein [Bradyrhizobium zhengyangense]
MSLVALIPARGGSKGVPRKNLALCGGRSLLDWTAEAALHSGVIDRAILSTDDDEIAEAGRALGLDVPFLRPADLAGDAALMLGVLQHCLAELRRAGATIEAIVLLQPTSPFRRAHHVCESVARFRETKAQTLVSVVRVPHRYVPEGQMREKEGRLFPYFGGGIGRVTRQDKERLYARNGPAVLIVRSSVLDAGLLYGDVIVGYEMDELSSFDIDTPEELRLADHLLRTGYVR